MLTSFPPGGAPNSINRQLPQGLSVPGLQQQAAGQSSPFGQIPGTLGGQNNLFSNMFPGYSNNGTTMNGSLEDPGNLTGVISALANKNSNFGMQP